MRHSKILSPSGDMFVSGDVFRFRWRVCGKRSSSVSKIRLSLLVAC